MNYELWVMRDELWGMSAGWSREVEIFCFMKRFFTMLRFVQNNRVLFLLMIRNLYYWGGFFLNRKGFYYWIAFLSELSWRNSFALKRGGNCIYSITKFTEMWWNDGFFEGSEEHWSSKSGDFAQPGAGWGMMWWYGDMVREKTKCAKLCRFVNGYKPFSNWN